MELKQKVIKLKIFMCTKIKILFVMVQVIKEMNKLIVQTEEDQKVIESIIEDKRKKKARVKKLKKLVELSDKYIFEGDDMNDPKNEDVQVPEIEIKEGNKDVTVIINNNIIDNIPPCLIGKGKLPSGLEFELIYDQTRVGAVTIFRAKDAYVKICPNHVAMSDKSLNMTKLNENLAYCGQIRDKSYVHTSSEKATWLTYNSDGDVYTIETDTISYINQTKPKKIHTGIIIAVDVIPKVILSGSVIMCGLSIFIVIMSIPLKGYNTQLLIGASTCRTAKLIKIINAISSN